VTGRTIPELFRRAVDDVPDKVWLVAGDTSLTYGDALTAVGAGAARLRAEGVAPGDRVMCTASNRVEHVLAWLALMEVGAVQVPVNPAGTPTELAGLVDQVRPRLLLLDTAPPAAEDPPTAATPTAGTPTAGTPALVVDDLFAGEPDGRGPSAVDERDVAVMIPTSGTTGRSKLVMQTHLAYVMAGEGFPWWMGLDAGDRLMTSLPLFHINAPAYTVLGSVGVRASVALLPSFSASTFLESARRPGATEFNAIGAMLEILMRQPERPDDSDNPLRLCYTGPAPDEQRHRRIEERFGIGIVCGYGMSETPYALIWAHGTRPYGTLGSVRQHPTLGHVNDARIRDVGQGDVGELELRNPAIMRGYFEMPDETAAVLVDGWLRTGDLVTENDDGTYTFVGRAKQVIRRRGENLSPLEVEAVLERHADVAEAAVIGVPSDLSEEDVKAFVVAAPGRAVDVAALHAHAAAHLARFKVPRYVEVVGDLPHTPTGRLAKHRLPTERTPAETDLEAG
jgi:carnitine-CoA ligase